MILITLQGAATPCAAQCGYEITAVIVGPECGSGQPAIIQPQAVNEQGWVAGWFNCPGGLEHPFIWYGIGPVVELDLPPGGQYGRVLDMDNSGCVVGEYVEPGSGFGDLGFWSDGQTVQTIWPLPGANHCDAVGMNSHGQVVGYSLNVQTGDPPSHAFLWEGGDPVNLNPALGTTASAAADINDAGVVTGSMGENLTYYAHGFIWDGQTVTDIGVIPEGQSAKPTAINEPGEVCGTGKVIDPNPPGWVKHAFFYSDGEMIDLGTFPGYEESFARDINNNGEIVGYCYAPGSDISGFIWRDGEMQNLNDLIPPAPFTHVDIAYSINDAGQIVAHGSANGFPQAGLLLTPQEGPPGDLNGDCIVDIADLLLLLGQWGQGSSQADLNGDGVVNVLDLLLLLGNWS